MSKNEQMVGISRRTLVKSTAIGSLALAAGGFSLPFTLRNAAASVQQAREKVVWGACSVNCGSRCALRLHVKDNEVTWVETDNTGSDEYGNHQVRACLRGRSIRRRINHPDRLNYPMKRVGKRGEGKFERISWDEALDTIASSLKKTVEQYGNEAVYIQYSSGIVGGNMTRSSPSASAVKRLMNCYGGSLNQYGSYSTAQISCAMPYTYGSNDGNSTTDIENSKLVVMFGNNPAETRMSGGGITYLLEKAREKSNAKMIVIDPRYTDTAAGREDEWLPIRPGTDAALVAGIAWVGRRPSDTIRRKTRTDELYRWADSGDFACLSSRRRRPSAALTLRRTCRTATVHCRRRHQISRVAEAIPEFYRRPLIRVGEGARRG